MCIMLDFWAWFKDQIKEDLVQLSSRPWVETNHICLKDKQIQLDSLPLKGLCQTQLNES